MSMKIGELAEQTRCQVVTIRYYEKEGLLAKPARGYNGYRLYTSDDVERLKFIRHCRSHSIALDEIKVLLKIRETPDRDCSEVSDLVDRHIKQVDEQLKSLKKLKEQLVRLRKKCPHGGAVSSCGIIKGLTDRKICGCLAEDDQPAA